MSAVILDPKQARDARAVCAGRDTAAIKTLQILVGVKDDGQAGRLTRNAVEDAAARFYGITIDRDTLKLPDSQYIHGPHPKDALVIHHTAGDSAESSVKGWTMDQTRVGTAYLTGRDGHIYEVFPPEHSAGNLGLGGRQETRTVGIEVCNWGWLKRQTGGRYAAWPRRNGVPTTLLPSDQVLVRQWRGEDAWEVYPEAQIVATIALARYVVARFGIDPDVAPGVWDTRHADYERFKRFRGVFGHCHVRADKTDPHPGFPWDRLTQAVEADRGA